MSSENQPLKQNRQMYPTRGIRKKRRVKRRQLRFRLVYVAYIMVPIILGVVLFAIQVSNALSDVKQAQSDLDIVLNTIEEKSATELTIQDYEQIDDSLASLSTSLSHAKSITRVLRPLGVVSPDFESQFYALDAAIDTTEATRFFLQGMRPTIRLLERGGVVAGDSTTPNTTPGITAQRSVELLRAANSSFVIAQSRLSSAEQTINNIQMDKVSGERLLDIQTLLDFHEQISTYNTLALEAPELLTLLLGLDESQTYLVLAQNNDEIRPSGGYISTWGYIRVRSGDIQDFRYFPTTLETPDPPPQELGSEISIPDWWLSYQNPITAAWDGSWYADFARTAEMAAWYYNNGNNPFVPVDGVIALDIVAVQYMIEALGNVTIPEYDRTVNAQNFRESIYSVRAAGEGLEHKEFLVAMYGQVIDAWQTATIEQRGNINRAILQSLREKHLILYFADPALQSAARDLNWSGQINIEAEQDYLMVADANRGNKSSSAVQREIIYDAIINADGSVDSRVSVFYDYSAVIAEADPAVRPEHYGNQQDYASVFQLIVPPGSELLSTEGFLAGATTVNNEDYTIFTGELTVIYNDNTRIQLQYRQPDAVSDLGGYNRYVLDFDKQAGSNNDSATVAVFLPLGSTIIDVSPEPSSIDQLGQTVYEFVFRLDESRTIEIIYSG